MAKFHIPQIACAIAALSVTSQRARRALALATSIAFVGATSLQAAEIVVDAQDTPMGSWADLKFPAGPEPFSSAPASKMFKPEGVGPFPGLVILPTCGGLPPWFQVFDWARHALQRGYAVLVVDPLTPRGVVAPGENCRFPPRVSISRQRKDAVDAAEHLRRQPFVDRDRIGFMGFSFGAMTGLGLSGAPYANHKGRPAFRAVASSYPTCFVPNRPSPVSGRIVDVRFLPQRVTVPLLVQMGELDTESPARDCVPLLQQQKKAGAPVEFIVHKGATHVWDAKALGDRAFSRTTSLGRQVEYRYNAEVTAQSVRLAFDFLDRHVKRK
jgi:dienelactone hydrolase